MKDGRIAVHLSDISTMDRHVDHRILALLSFNHSIGCPTRFTIIVTSPQRESSNPCSMQKHNSIEINDHAILNVGKESRLVGSRNTIDRKVDTRREFRSLLLLHLFRSV